MSPTSASHDVCAMFQASTTSEGRPLQVALSVDAQGLISELDASPVIPLPASPTLAARG